jgi:2OG-Fe(II) oxygenase superfamily
VLDHFLVPDYANQLLQSFPAFESGSAMGDDGKMGNKSTIARIRKLGSAYAALDDLIQSPQFLTWLGRATGMTDLLYDPFYLGGGTHNNRHGMHLNPHIDFNFHPSERWHRRLNLIIYLNDEWQDAWGGALELFKNPHVNGVADVSIVPVFNRCVIFETSEHSWHGFDTITLPPAHAARSRKSIALYFYSKTRPANEIAPKHTTVYVQRLLSEKIKAGHTLSAADVDEIQSLIDARDAHIRWQYDENTRLLQAQERGLVGQFLYLAKRAYVRLRR